MVGQGRTLSAGLMILPQTRPNRPSETGGETSTPYWRRQTNGTGFRPEGSLERRGIALASLLPRNLQ